MSTINLREITDFGGIDADADSLLDECFEAHEAYSAAKDHKRFLIVGRKGSGKTAIYRRLIRSRDYSDFPIGHTFDDYPWHFHDHQAVAGVPAEERFLHSWKYLILITLSKVLLNQDNSQPWSSDSLEAVTKIEKGTSKIRRLRWESLNTKNRTEAALHEFSRESFDQIVKIIMDFPLGIMQPPVAW